MEKYETNFATCRRTINTASGSCNTSFVPMPAFVIHCHKPKDSNANETGKRKYCKCGFHIAIVQRPRKERKSPNLDMERLSFRGTKLATVIEAARGKIERYDKQQKSGADYMPTILKQYEYGAKPQKPKKRADAERA